MGLACIVWFVSAFSGGQRTDKDEEGKIRLWAGQSCVHFESWERAGENFTQINLTAQKMRTRLQLHSEVSCKYIFCDTQCEYDTHPIMIYIYIIYQLCKYSAVKLSSDERLPTAQLCSEFKEFYQSYLINLQTFNEPNKVKIAVQWKRKNKE